MVPGQGLAVARAPDGHAFHALTERSNSAFGLNRAVGVIAQAVDIGQLFVKLLLAGLLCTWMQIRVVLTPERS